MLRYLHVSDGEWFVRNARMIRLIGLGLVLSVGVAIAILFWGQWQANRWVAHTRDVRQYARILLVSILDAETRQRGYLLSGGDRSYLPPFVSTANTIPRNLERLTTLSTDNPSQLRRLKNLKPLVSAKLEELWLTSRLAEQGRVDEAVAMTRSGHGRDLMDDIRAEMDGFIATEQRLLIEREENVQLIRASLLAFITFSLVTSVTLLGLLGRANQQAIASLKARQAELEGEIERREKAESTLRQAQKMEAVGQLTGGIAHDFNNLLTVILGNLDTLKRKLSSGGSDLHKPVENAMLGARSAAQLTQRLLAFSRRQMLAPVRLDLNRLVQDMSDMLRRTLGEAIEVETVLAGGLWPTFADANQLENALLNLAINARDAMPDGGRLTIETGNAALDEAYAAHFGDITPGQYVMLIVSDTGTGIAPDIIERVLEPFFTTKQNGGGSGLGLSMVYGFVRQSGGHLRIYSEVGQGTTVKIYLPRLTETAETASTPSPAPETREPMPRGCGEVVLVVEDNEAVRDYAASALNELGYATRIAGTAEEALRIIRKGERVDLVFTDVVLPGGLSGRELAKEVEALRPGLPVLYTTGYTRNAIVHGGRLDANVQLLQKPYTLHELSKKVRALIDRKVVA